MRGGERASPSKGHTEINETNNYASSHTQFTPINLMSMFLNCEVAGVPGENPRIYGENMQTPHRKAPGRIQTRNPLAVRRQC